MRGSLLAVILVVGIGLFSAFSEGIVSLVAESAASTTSAATAAKSPIVDLGRALFFDERLSRNENQSCATCHDAEFGFTGPKVDVNMSRAVYEGSVPRRFGNRKPPTAAYATTAPILHFAAVEGVWIGGNFWDGRATGEDLGNPAADQALGPFLNPDEQALPDRSCVVYKVLTGEYAALFHTVWGLGVADVSFPDDMTEECRNSSDEFDVDFAPAHEELLDSAFDQVGWSIAAFEASPEVNAFSSRYDAWKADSDLFTDQERLGFELFTGERALCSDCHPADLSDPVDLFTDYSFDNLGIPKNPENPVYGTDPYFVDLGLGGFLEDPAEYGKQRVPTLRNVDKQPGQGRMKAFGHNGYFKSLEQIVHFYNTRDVKPTCPGPYTADEAMAADCWPAPEVAMNVNTDELGDLGLTAAEEAAIVAFMRTLSDE